MCLFIGSVECVVLVSKPGLTEHCSSTNQQGRQEIIINIGFLHLGFLDLVCFVWLLYL